MRRPARVLGVFSTAACPRTHCAACVTCSVSALRFSSRSPAASPGRIGRWHITVTIGPITSSVSAQPCSLVNSSVVGIVRVCSRRSTFGNVTLPPFRPLRNGCISVRSIRMKYVNACRIVA